MSVIDKKMKQKLTENVGDRKENEILKMRHTEKQ